MSSLRFTPVALAAGLFLAITFTLCVIWGLIFPHTALQKQFLEGAFPWFTWLSWESLFVGLGESFLYGVYVAVVFVPLYNGLSRWTGQASARA